MHDLLCFERLLSDLSARFIALCPGEIDGAIHDSLARIVSTLGIDRSTLSRVFPLSGRMQVTHSFAAEGIGPAMTNVSAREFAPWSLDMMMANRPVVFERLDDLPPDATVDKETLRSIGLKSHVTMPIIVAGELHGALSFGCVRAERRWPEDLLNRMRLLANVFGSALARKHAQEQLDHAIGFERLASSILASLVLAEPGQSEVAIGIGLRQIGRFMEAERIGLWDRGSGDLMFRAVQRWHADGFAPPSTLGEPPDLPWIMHRLAAGNIVRLPRVSELPPEADGDRAALQASGVRSLLVVPISVPVGVTGALAIASTQRAHEWPEALMPGVSLLAEVFGSLHARDTAERRKLAAEVEAAHWRERLAHLVRVHTAGEMSVALAHEITQPLGAIENYALAARRRAGESAPDMTRVSELLDKVIGQATRAGEVVTRMRDMVQRHELEPKLIDIQRAIAECIGMVKMDCDLRDIEIRLSEASRLPPVIVDEIHLQQVVLNLLRNAMDAIGHGSGERAIGVSVMRNEGDEIQVEVADTGTGIANGDLERIFESFYSTKASGLGVGLAICRKLIEAHGGRLWASHRAGGGALFRFTIPIAVQGD
ncbi:ATP-binding protein [Variovorax ginsengisoli]|uniref:histidine kinase n=1 Tax=Variovorax ginsengisoli TaxID=363844 RepID=A0ABT8S7Y9_9BURK|nr:ATP-binding protein [Variovorax ginsengisoli]MDN8614356.1 ATP-binding protein [Variovorax ginsengisoli]MDO1533526.1 ATP-binding protein [Variovorax ginsengisoli]